MKGGFFEELISSCQEGGRGIDLRKQVIIWVHES